MPSILEVKEGLQLQTSSESVVYTVEVANYPGSGNPTLPSALVFDTSDESDVTATVMPDGSHTISGTIITLKALKLLTAGKVYRVQVTFTRSANIFEPYFRVKVPY